VLASQTEIAFGAKFAGDSVTRKFKVFSIETDGLAGVAREKVEVFGDWDVVF
jgi:hypothetical protein